MTFSQFSIEKAVSDELFAKKIQLKIDQKTKPQGSLGALERLALRIALAQGSEHPKLTHPHILIFAADHGITQEGVSAYPKEVTAQMVLNFTHGNAAINVFSRQNGLALRVIDAGVDADFSGIDAITSAKIGFGTKNFLYEDAMTEHEMQQAIQHGSRIIAEIHEEGSNVVGFGEMGIGNTTSAAAIMHLITQKPLEYCVGAGTGLLALQIQQKRAVIAQAIANARERHRTDHFSPSEIVRIVGGFEIAMMCGAMLEAASHRMMLLIDGFIASSALLLAAAEFPQIVQYCVFAHESDENGHATMLRYLGGEPLLRLGMRLGEGTGAALAYPLVQAAVNFLNEMATFDSANVSTQVLP
ncbi:MAG: nicotinate-nucleotide--dimethylbenzimidazole phosphoribosyltransferase [Candidatus Kapabacteria bacterium]|jgi:nicotinate-nucleotide--dimethylbenzimidazole phosphoribosyltransferase|nr:nicotinate-nucleotide--dimethylbenzimidazole phosphoribosyltransferase [Candidatus Kapabacteria bacterium]